MCSTGSSPLELDLAEEVEAKECEHYDPDCEVNLSVKDTPVVSLVSNAEELQTEGNLDESEDNLHRVEPATTA